MNENIENIRLDYAANSDKKMQEISMMMITEPGIKDIFSNKAKRFTCTEYAWLIKDDDKNIGFISLVKERQDNNFLFLDIGIKQDYRNKGIGTHAIKRVKEILAINNINTYVIGETSIDNIYANGAIRKLGCLVTHFQDRSLYLLQKEKINRFIDDGYYDKLQDHLELNDKRILIKEY